MTAVPTIYDVASHAGVSISTVSLALNKPDRVRKATLARIMDAVDDLGFIPRAEAVTRARRGVRRIGVIGPFSSHPSFARRLNGILQRAGREHFEVVVYDEESAASSRLATLPLTRRVDGVVLLSLPLGEDVVRRLSEQRVSTVLVDAYHPGFSSVAIDDAAGGRLVAELFMRHGHDAVGFVGQAQAVEYESPSRLRLKGLRDGLAKPPNVVLVEHGFESARVAARESLSSVDRPSAIFAYDDLLAGGVLRAARDLGLRVPEDLEIVGFDDSELAEPLGLTTVRQPLEESGEVATEMLLAEMEDPSRTARQTSLALKLIERESTRRE